MALLPPGKFYTYTATTSSSMGFPIDWVAGIDWACQPISKQEKVWHGNAEGFECNECSDFYPMAELNLPEGSKEPSAFQCYCCRKGLKTLFGRGTE